MGWLATLPNQNEVPKIKGRLIWFAAFSYDGIGTPNDIISHHPSRKPAWAPNYLEQQNVGKGGEKSYDIGLKLIGEGGMGEERGEADD